LRKRRAGQDYSPHPVLPRLGLRKGGGQDHTQSCNKMPNLYLSISVFPVAPDEVAYQRSFENTLLAFLVFSGIYLLISMTASILREQVSA
jgi:hypothetical protein